MEIEFRELNDQEREEFKQWARDNYMPNTEINSVWHPVVRKECRIISLNYNHRQKLKNEDVYGNAKGTPFYQPTDTELIGIITEHSEDVAIFEMNACDLSNAIFYDVQSLIGQEDGFNASIFASDDVDCENMTTEMWVNYLRKYIAYERDLFRQDLQLSTGLPGRTLSHDQLEEIFVNKTWDKLPKEQRKQFDNFMFGEEFMNSDDKGSLQDYDS